MGCCCSDEHSAIKETKRAVPIGDSDAKKYFQNKQGLWIRWRLWPTAAGMPVRAVAVLVHGFGEHVDRYEHIANSFNEHGVILAGMDHQGHGLSEGDRAHVQLFSHYVEDVLQFATAVLPANLPAGVPENTPFFIFGHSMGGLISSHVLLRSQASFRGAIISAPAVLADPKVATPAMRNIANRLSNVFPKLALDKLDPTLVTRDAAVVAKYSEDPLVYHGGMRARWGHEMLLAMDSFWKDAAKITLPLLLIHGTDDKLIPIAASEKYEAAVSSSDKTFLRYEGFFHESFNDPGKEAVIQDMMEFVERLLLRRPF
jgi:acylglycerol lipase